jgi:putative PEP-CTERM system TPR-repeat lipoprotein
MKILYVALILSVLISCSKQSANDYVDSAKQYMAQNKDKAATIELKNALQQSPKLAEARFLLGKLYLKSKQYQGAEKELNRALAYDYPAAEVIPLLSRAYKKTKTDIGLLALDHQQQDLTAAQSVEIAFYKLQAHLRLEQETKAKALIEESKDYQTDSPFKTLFKVYSLLLSHHGDAALLQLEILLEQTPGQLDALKLQANLLLQLEKAPQALVSYRRYYELYPDDVEMAFIFARLLTDLNFSAEAEPIVDKLLQVNSEHMLLNQLKGIARFTAKDNANALLYSEKAILAKPKDPALRLIAGYSAYLLEDYETAHRHLSLIADRLSPAHKALRLLAASQLKLGLNLQASDTLNQLDDISTKDATLFSSVGLALVRSGEITQAQSLLNKTPKTSDSVTGLTRLGLLKLSLNDISGVSHLEQALEQAPEMQSTQITLATAYLTTGQLDKSISLAEQWKHQDVNDSKAYMLAGMAYMKAKNYDQAQAEFEQLIEITPDNVRAKLALIDLAHNKGDTGKARRQLESLLIEHPGNGGALAKLYLLVKPEGDIEPLMQRIRYQVQLHPENIELHYIFAKILLNEGQVKRAQTLLEAMPVKGNMAEPYWKMLGQIYLSLQQVDIAKAHYNKWLDVAPNNSSALLGNLILMDLSGDYKDALAVINNIMKKRELEVEIQLLHIQFLMMDSNFFAANKLYKQLPATVIGHAYTKGLLGQLQIHDKNYLPALENLTAAYLDRPTPRNVALMYFCYTKLGQHNASYEFMLVHAKNFPTDLSSLMLLAGIEVNIDGDKAIKTYEKALVLAPDNFIALNNLAYFYLQGQQLELAEQYANRALALRPQHAAVQDTMAQILIEKKQYDAALSYLTKAVSNKNVKEEIYLNYIEALLLAEQQTLALRKIDQREFTLAQSLIRLSSIKKRFEISD